MIKFTKAKGMQLLQYLYARLREGSTIRGIVVVIATWLCHHEPKNLEMIVWVAGCVVGAIGILWPEVAHEPKQD